MHTSALVRRPRKAVRKHPYRLHTPVTGARLAKAAARQRDGDIRPPDVACQRCSERLSHSGARAWLIAPLHQQERGARHGACSVLRQGVRAGARADVVGARAGLARAQ